MELGKIIYLCIVHGICTYTDIKERKIKNCCVVAVLLGAVMLWMWYGESCMVKESLKVGLAFFLILIPLYYIRALGAGDVKLLCVTGLYIGSEGIEVFLTGLLIASGSMSLLKLLYYRRFSSRMGYFLAYIRKVVLTGEMDEYGIPEEKEETLGLALPMLVGVIGWGVWSGLL